VDGFVRAYDHYKSEKLVQPLAEERKLEIIGEADQEFSIRIRLQRASLIRKFIPDKLTFPSEIHDIEDEE
jgi:predicted aminopeptidase